MEVEGEKMTFSEVWKEEWEDPNAQNIFRNFLYRDRQEKAIVFSYSTWV